MALESIFKQRRPEYAVQESGSMLQYCGRRLDEEERAETIFINYEGEGLYTGSTPSLHCTPIRARACSAPPCLLCTDRALCFALSRSVFPLHRPPSIFAPHSSSSMLFALRVCPGAIHRSLSTTLTQICAMAERIEVVMDLHLRPPKAEFTAADSDHVQAAVQSTLTSLVQSVADTF